MSFAAPIVIVFISVSVSDNDTLINKKNTQPPPYSRSPHGACHQTKKQGIKKHATFASFSTRTRKTKKIDATTREKNKRVLRIVHDPMKGRLVESRSWNDVEENEKSEILLEYRTCVSCSICTMEVLFWVYLLEDEKT